MAHLSRTAALLALAGLTVAPAQAAEVTLRAVNAFTEGSAFAKPFERFIDKVNEDGAGKVRIAYIGGPGAMPPFEVGNAVKAGVVDMANVTSAFYTGLVPQAEALKLATRTIQEQRQNGAWEAINRIHNERMNTWYLARTGDGVPFHLYLTKPVKGADLSGLTIRTTPIYRAFFESLGANLVQTAPGEVYTALERGVVDGYGWPIQGIFDLGWQERTKYRVDPGFYQVDVNILVNLDTWNRLDDAQKAVLNKAATWIEAENAKNAEVNAAEVKRQTEAGIAPITLSDAERKTWLEAAAEAGWAKVAEMAPQDAAELRRLLAE